MTAAAMRTMGGLGAEAKTDTRAKSAADRDRLHLALTPRQKERLEFLREATEAPSNTDVIRNALRLYDALVQEVQNGNEVLVRDKDGNLISYRVVL